MQILIVSRILPYFLCIFYRHAQGIVELGQAGGHHARDQGLPVGGHSDSNASKFSILSNSGM